GDAVVALVAVDPDQERPLLGRVDRPARAEHHEHQRGGQGGQGGAWRGGGERGNRAQTVEGSAPWTGGGGHAQSPVRGGKRRVHHKTARALHSCARLAASIKRFRAAGSMNIGASPAATIASSRSGHFPDRANRSTPTSQGSPS